MTNPCHLCCALLNWCRVGCGLTCVRDDLSVHVSAKLCVETIYIICFSFCWLSYIPPLSDKVVSGLRLLCLLKTESLLENAMEFL